MSITGIMAIAVSEHCVSADLEGEINYVDPKCAGALLLKGPVHIPLTENGTLFLDALKNRTLDHVGFKIVAVKLD